MCIIVHKFAEFGLRHCVGVEVFVLCMVSMVNIQNTCNHNLCSLYKFIIIP